MRTVQQRGKINDIKIQSLHTANNIFEFADCPEAIVTFGNSSKLYTALLDSGAQTSILPWEVFDQLNIGKEHITRVRHSLNLQGTTGAHADAIYGSFTMVCYCLLKQYNPAGRSFGRSKITFMVSKPDVRLEKIIMGIPWQKSVKMVLRMDEEVDKASCRLYSEGSIHRCNLQLKQNGKIWMTTNKVVDKADAHAIFEINSFFLQENVSLKLNKRNGIILPEVINLKNNIQIS